MSLALSVADRAAFLAEPRLGVLSVAPHQGRATLAAPIWFDVDPDGRVRVVTGAASQKGVAIEATGRFGIAVHEEQRPFRYVSVEGPVVERRPCRSEDLLLMAQRYLGEEAGRAYAEQWLTWDADDVVYVMEPQRWGSADHTPIFESLPGWPGR